MNTNHRYPPIRAAGQNTSDLTLTAAVDIRAADVDDDGKPKGPPTFSMDAYNGGPMQLRGWVHPVVVDLAGMQDLDRPRPVLRDHDMGQLVGHTTAKTVDNHTLKATGVISGHGPHVDEVKASAANGFPWQASIGAKVLQNEFVPKGETGTANGRTFVGPVNIARRSSLGEISFVPLGADQTTAARIAAQAAGVSAMKFRAWAKARGFTAEEMKDAATLAQLRAMFKRANPDADENDDSEDEADAAKAGAAAGDIAATATADAGAGAGAGAGAAGSPGAAAGGAARDTVADMLKQMRTAAAGEQKRLAAIQAKAEEYRERVEPAKFADIQAKATENGWDQDKVELEMLRAARPDHDVRAGTGSGMTTATFGINVGRGEVVTQEIVAAACALAGGVEEKRALEGLTDGQKQVVASRKVRNSVGSIYGMCSVIAAANGVRMPSSRMDEDVLKAMFAIERRLELQADGGGAGGFSTMSLSGITENVLNKAMLEAYGQVDSVIDQIAYQTDTNDFKPYKRYRLTSSGLMSALGPTGELKSISLQDESYANQVKTQGVIMNVPRELLINDDLGALTQAPTLLGRGAALYREMVVFSNILALPATPAPGNSVGKAANNFNFFSTGAGNLMTGAPSALTTTALQAATQKYREQVDANNMPIMLKPDRILIPPALEVVAENLFNGANLIATSLPAAGAVAAVAPSDNAYKGKYKPIVSPFLSQAVANRLKGQKGDPTFANFANASDTEWTLLCDPAGGFAIVQIGYLRGQRTPTIERGESNFNQLGMAMRMYWDFGVAPHDFRCGVQSTGV